MFALPPLLLAAAATAPCLAAADLPHVPIFTWGEGGYGGFREPGLLLLPTTQPTLLAFAEAGAIDLADGKLWQRVSGGGAGVLAALAPEPGRLRRPRWIRSAAISSASARPTVG